jgi:hypothetical protein
MISPAPTTGVKATSDPLINLQEPSTTGMAVYSGDVGSHTGAVQLKPGNYTSQLSISAGANVIFEPGVYVLQNGIDVSGSATISGTGVLLYIAGGNVNFSGNSQGQLSPATTGTYAGLTVFQARNNSAQANLSGNANWSLSGTFYFPNAAVNLSGNSETTLPMQFIVYDLSLSGNCGN